MLIFHSFKGSGSTFSRLHQRLLKSFKEAAISLRHLEKSILEGNLYFGPLEMILRILASGMTFRLPVIKTIFSQKKVDFCTISPKNFEVKENCSKTQLNVCPLKCTYRGKKSFLWSEIMSWKSEQLELSFSINILLE